MASESYPVMQQDQLDIFRGQIRSVGENCPRAALVGGAALRVRLDQRDLPIPAPGSGDIDLVVNNYGLPEAGIHRFGGAVLDVFNTWVPFEPPFFEGVNYQGVGLKLATPEHLLVKKLEHLSVSPDAKNKTHVEILSKLVSAGSLAGYIASLRSQAPNYVELDENVLSRLSMAKD